MRRKSGTLLMIAGLVLLLSAGALSYSNIREEEEAEQYASSALAQIKKILPDMEKKTEEILTAASEPDGTALIAAQAENIVSEPRQMQTLQVEERTYIGVVQIPSLNLELPVQSDWSYYKLRRSPCRFYGSLADDTLVIAGHSVSAHFRSLRNIQVNANVVFTDAVGNVILYQVMSIENLGSAEAQKLITGDWDLTLFTCAPGAITRVVVRCNRVLA